VPVLNLSGNLGVWELDLDGAVAGGGANVAQVCRAAARTGMSGVEDLIGTASSIGGAVHAASLGQLQIAGVLDWVDVGRPGGPVERIRLADRRGRGEVLRLDLDRRVVVRARLQLLGNKPPSTPAKSPVLHRNGGQRQTRSAEPLFVDPVGARAETLLTEAECVDLKVGATRISRQQPNRIFTSKTTRASDVLELTRMARDRVFQRAGIDLQPAICFVDEDGRKVDL